jgi:hypothetical protein
MYRACFICHGEGAIMKLSMLVALLLILPLTAMVNATETAYQWTDRQGQIHYGDAPPASVKSRPIMLRKESKQGDNQVGLRAGERRQIVQIEQRTREQQRRAQAARTRIDNQRASKQARCANNRKMLNISRDRDTFKQYARYLRNNCW